MEFETLKEAEDYYWENLAINNDDESGLGMWLETGIEFGDIIINEEI